jgi:hypothetical protein
MAPADDSPLRVRPAHVAWVAERLGERDWAIIESISRLRLLTGTQLERLHFADLAPSARSRIRRRVLARLASWRVLMTLERRIGGVRAGSAGLIFTLDMAGRHLVALKAGNDSRLVRRADSLGHVLTAHTLAVSELYVSLVELSRTDDFQMVTFAAEPACWWPNGYGGWLKPDAFLVLAVQDHADAWWVEQDMGTEHLTTIRRKLETYLSFAQRGIGPTGVVPRIVLSVTDEKRQAAITGLIKRLPEPASNLLHVTLTPQTPRYLLWVLRE